MAVEIDAAGATCRHQVDGAVPARPCDALDCLAKGSRLLQAHDYEPAIARFREALAHDGSFAEAWLQLGAALAAKGERAEALVALQTAHAEFPDHPLTRTRLAAVLIELGRNEEALSLRDQAIARDSGALAGEGKTVSP
jgi:tetratricopeptide (TPR) repeat protein